MMIFFISLSNFFFFPFFCLTTPGFFAKNDLPFVIL